MNFGINRALRKVALILIATGSALAVGAKEPPKPRERPKREKETKLWAAVSVSDPVLDWDNLAWELGTRAPFMIHFYLVNDGDKVIDPKIRSSKLLINGKAFKGKGGSDWPYIAANGPRDGRWKALPPGDYLAFGYAFRDDFKEPGTYRVKWKGEGFEAPEVVFRVMPRKKKADK
jgi:hypothetical protein